MPFAVLLLVGGLVLSRNEVAVSASAAEAQDSNGGAKRNRGVIALTAKNFDSSLKDGKAWLIEFYAPWCGHCTRFASTYEQVAHQLHNKQLSPDGVVRHVQVAKVDGAAERALSSRFGVNSFPTFFLVDGWTVREFQGTRSQEGLIQFALEDYEKTEPLPFLFGPFGPMGQLRSFLMRSGTWAVGLYDNLTEERGMKPLMAMSILCVGGLSVGLVSIIILGLLFLPKAKMD